MTMHVYASVSADEIAEKFSDDPEFMMDVLAAMAENTADDEFDGMAEGFSGSQFHQGIPVFCRKLADAIDKLD